MTDLAHNTMPKRHRWMVIWLVLSVIGLQIVSTMVSAEQLLSASDAPCHSTELDTERSHPCCDEGGDCGGLSQCKHNPFPTGIANIEQLTSIAWTLENIDLPEPRHGERFYHPPFRPPITS